MCIYHMHKNLYKLSALSMRAESREKYEKIYEPAVKKWQKLKSEGVSDGVAAEFTGISRSTFFRYKRILCNLKKNIYPPSKAPKNKRKSHFSESIKQLILGIRRENPTYGKNKISVIIKRDHGVNISESSVGRIIKDFMNRGLIQKSISAPRERRKRRFIGHAKPWNGNLKATKPGQMVQIDHMTTSKNNVSGKYFQAWDHTSKFIDAMLTSSATAKSARRFLDQLIKNAPFKIISIQVDGGSECMAEFEEACSELGIALYVLPPKRPQYNGGVERGNRIFREEFYARRDIKGENIGSLNFELKAQLKKYNTYRPHFSLKGLTPLQYINNFLEVA